MNKAFKTYALIWVIILIVFNVICFVTPSEIAGEFKYTGSFWAAYVFITMAFIGQLYCANLAFKAENLKRLFYNIPLISISYTGLIVMLIVGGISMLISAIPTWIGIIVCLIILAFTSIAVVKASAAADVVEKIDNKIKEQSSFIRSITSEAQVAFNSATEGKIKTECKKVYEAFRYSDPVTSDGLIEIEEKIRTEMNVFVNQVASKNIEGVTNSGERLLSLIETRNSKCKLMK